MLIVVLVVVLLLIVVFDLIVEFIFVFVVVLVLVIVVVVVVLLLCAGRAGIKRGRARLRRAREQPDLFVVLRGKARRDARERRRPRDTRSKRGGPEAGARASLYDSSSAISVRLPETLEPSSLSRR